MNTGDKEKVTRPRNRARWSGDWHIITPGGLSMESHYSEKEAQDWCISCNEHETRNGRSADYTVLHESLVTGYCEDYGFYKG